MSEWWTYTLADFLLFSPRVYYRLFELYNRSFWPVAIVSLALGLAIFCLLLRPTRGSHLLIPAILGALWILISWAFFWERYASINWASVYLAPLFGLQGVALLCTGAVSRRITFAPRREIPDIVALALFSFSLIGYPFLAELMGRPLLTAEIFGLAPDPTALTTLALLVLANNGVRWPLLIVPLIWCLITGLTLWAMEASDFFIAPVGALSALAIAVFRTRRGLAMPSMAGTRN
jgi:Family of unknown function (DUF6064)